AEGDLHHREPEPGASRCGEEVRLRFRRHSSEAQRRYRLPAATARTRELSRRYDNRETMNRERLLLRAFGRGAFAGNLLCPVQQPREDEERHHDPQDDRLTARMPELELQEQPKTRPDQREEDEVEEQVLKQPPPPERADLLE